MDKARLDGIIIDLEARLRANPADEQVAIHLGYALAENGRLVEAFDIFADLPLDTNFNAFIGFIVVSARQGMIRSSWPIVSEASKRWGGNGDFLTAMGHVMWAMYCSPFFPLNKQSYLVAAERALFKSLGLSLQNVRVNAHVSKFLSAIGREAAKDYEKTCLRINKRAAAFWLSLPLEDTRWIPQRGNPFIDLQGNTW
ncbi:MAG: hypothetical protein JW839_21615 [Candidatus Lokiarchaeota archaeon]|nr:hypothetical protein [Candidatus Lokiarchaeota archaeon]